MNHEHKAQIAQIYEVELRQLNRWITARAPVLVAHRMASHLLGRNFYGKTGSLLQDPSNVARIQRALDRLLGEDLAASAKAFEAMVEIDDTIARLTRTVHKSRLNDKAALLKGAKALTSAMRALDKFEFVDPALPYSAKGAEEIGPEELT